MQLIDLRMCINYTPDYLLSASLDITFCIYTQKLESNREVLKKKKCEVFHTTGGVGVGGFGVGAGVFNTQKNCQNVFQAI